MTSINVKLGDAFLLETPPNDQHLYIAIAFFGFEGAAVGICLANAAVKLVLQNQKQSVSTESASMSGNY